MASNRPTGFGLSRELAEKNAAKYSQDDEVRIRILWPKNFEHFCGVKLFNCEPEIGRFQPITGHKSDIKIRHIDGATVNLLMTV